MAQSRRELQRLEQELTLRFERRSLRSHRDHTCVLFIFARRPGPGTQAGGAASHIKGVVEGLEALGVEVQMISNDLIAD